MGKLKTLQKHEKPQEAYTLLKRLLEGQGNGETPCTLEGLQSKAKKLALQGKGEKGKEKDLGKALAIAEKRLRSLLLEIPNPDVFDHLCKDKVATLLTAGQVRYERVDKDQPPPVTKVRESWVGLPAKGRDNSEDREDPSAMEFKLPPMELEPGEEGVWLFTHMTKDTPDDEYVGVAAPQKSKDWEEPARFLDAIKLQEIKDPDLVFAPCQKKILPYQDLFGQGLG